ncbi:hypothetical protein E1A91_A04G070600v1 [Gossypium mustelinum]|uniref:Uncharacterized protein n=1 Tax=Gossypium mustelinum TaxID=34275 RepID=A0A5D2ZP46_GOSMU|nr:hypothetical protein E1A91_A04G070600v1 [Gossypium mustelinum]
MSSFPSPLQTQTRSQHSQGNVASPFPNVLREHENCLCKCLNQICSVLSGNFTDDTPSSSTTQLSPTLNLSHEYSLALQNNSYNEIRHMIEAQMQVENVIEGEVTDTHHLRLSPVLRPNRDCVHQALLHTNPNAKLTHLLSTYFDHSENITTLCLMLRQCVSRARTLYAPITHLLQDFPYDPSSIHISQCNSAIDVFTQFDSLDNPFPSPDSHDFNEMHHSFSQLKEQLDHHRNKSLSRFRVLHRATSGSAFCLIGTVVGVAISAVVISTHALAAFVGLVSTSLCPIYVPSHLKKKQLAHMTQLYAAARSGTFFHINYLESIVCLVDLLHSAVKGDRELIRIALKSRDIYPIYEVVKYLRNSRNKFFDKLKELEDHIYFCFDAVNKSRANLVDQIHPHQSSNS